MKLYLLKRPDDLTVDWDEIDSAVVAAKSPTAARNMYPKEDTWGDYCFKDGSWYDTKYEWKHDCWIPPDKVVVEYIGIAKSTEPKVILVSFVNG